jgi:hypothetical protein
MGYQMLSTISEVSCIRTVAPAKLAELRAVTGEVKVKASAGDGQTTSIY